MYQPESIDQALSLLNKKLEREGITIELTVLGSMALYYHGITVTHHHGADELRRHLKDIK
jgi:hypothetical protein